jgi:tetratricopeptide (TPR) repeat protein
MHYSQAIKLAPSKAEALVRIGDCYAAMHDYEAASRSWDKAIQASPQAKQLLENSITKEQQRRSRFAAASG